MSGHSASNRLWLAIRFPHLVWQAQGFALDDEQYAIVTEKQKVIWASPAAIAEGVCLGMVATTAEILSGCTAYPRQPNQEEEQLASLSKVAYEFTPYIEIYKSPAITQAGLLLELSSCVNLFGGLLPLVNKIKNAFIGFKLDFLMGQAHSAYAAWLLSFVNYPLEEDSSREHFIERLKLVPIQWLQDYPKAVDALDKMGFTLLDDIARQIEIQSISSIKKRFGHEFTHMLCELFSIDQNFQQASLFEKPLTYYQPTEYFTEQIQFDYPIATSNLLEKPIAVLLKKLSHYLVKRQLAAQDIEWRLADIYRREEIFHVTADRLQSHWQLFYDLTLIQLESRSLSFEVDSLSLKCDQLMPVENQNLILDFDQQHKKSQGQSFTITAAKLKARLGDASIVKLSYRDSHIPEVSNHTISVNESSEQTLPDIHRQGFRPAWLFKHPVPIEDRRGLFWRGRIRLIAGPERIQGLWWQTPTARDYFVAHRNDNVRLWIFHDLHKQSWFVQGIFG
jgi:protein ImuB